MRTVFIGGNMPSNVSLNCKKREMVPLMFLKFPNNSLKILKRILLNMSNFNKKAKRFPKI